MRWVPIAEEDAVSEMCWSGRNTMNKVRLRVTFVFISECSQVREISAKKPEKCAVNTCLSKNLTTRIEVLHHSLQIFRSAKI